MTSSKLGEVYIDFTARGFITVQGIIQKTTESLAKGAAAAVRFTSALAAGGVRTAFSASAATVTRLTSGLNSAANAGAQMGQILTGVTSSVYALASGGGALGGFFGSISEGTVEGDRLSKSLTYLKRVISDGLAPFVRQFTQGILELANWYRNLDDGVKQSVATWTAVALGVGTLTAGLSLLIPVAGGLAAAFVAMWGALTSPIVAIPILIAGVAAGFAALWGYITGDGEKAWANLTDSSQSWFDRIADGIIWMTTQFAKFFNWVGDLWTKTVNKMAGWIDKLKDNLDLTDTQKAFFEGLRDGAKMTGDLPVINIDKLKEKMLGFKGWVANNLNIGNLFPGMDAALNRIKKAGEDKRGFGIKLGDVAFEGLGGSFDRLSKAFAQNSAYSYEQQQLAKLEAIDKSTSAIAGGIASIKDLFPPIR